MQSPQFWYKYLAYHLRWNPITISIVSWFHILRENVVIWARLITKKKYDTKKKLMIITRFFEMQTYQNELESKYTQRAMSQFIADLSAQTGVPQWELRAKIKSDYNIDI